MFILPKPANPALYNRRMLSSGGATSNYPIRMKEHRRRHQKPAIRTLRHLARMQNVRDRNSSDPMLDRYLRWLPGVETPSIVSRTIQGSEKRLLDLLNRQRPGNTITSRVSLSWSSSRAHRLGRQVQGSEPESEIARYNPECAPKSRTPE